MKTFACTSFLLIYVIFINACKNEEFSKKETYTPIDIDNSKISPFENISAFIDTISVIPLIEKPGYHFSSVFKVLTSRNKYIIYDRLNSNKILLFNNDGSFNKIICKVGDGINDPLNMTDMWLNDENELEVYDFAQMKVIKFDSLYTFQSSVKASNLYHFSSLISSKNGYVGYSNFIDFNKPFNDKFYNIAFLNSALTIIKIDKYYNKKYQGVLWPIYSQHFSRFHDSIRFIKSYDNKVYSITDNVLSERYKIEYKLNNIPDNVMKIVENNLQLFKNRTISPNVKAELFKKYSYLKGPWFETDKYIFIQSVDSVGPFGSFFLSLYDKSLQKEIFSTRKIVDTIKYKMELPKFNHYDRNNNELISVIPGVEFKNLLQKNSIFREKIAKDPYQFYLIKMKLKNAQ